VEQNLITELIEITIFKPGATMAVKVTNIKINDKSAAATRCNRENKTISASC
jgi:hypothetical protein